jgi:hypothetical protein
MTASNSSEIAIFGRIGNTWNLLSVSEYFQPTLPLSKVDNEDLGPIGVAIDCSIAFSENTDIHTATSLHPILVLLNADGVLSLYTIVSTQRHGPFSGLQKALELPKPLESQGVPVQQSIKPLTSLQTTASSSAVALPSMSTAFLPTSSIKFFDVSKPLGQPSIPNFNFETLGIETKKPITTTTDLSTPRSSAVASSAETKEQSISRIKTDKPFSFQDTSITMGAMNQSDLGFKRSSGSTMGEEKASSFVLPSAKTTNGLPQSSFITQSEKSMASTNHIQTTTNFGSNFT